MKKIQTKQPERVPVADAVEDVALAFLAVFLVVALPWFLFAFAR